MALLQKIYQRSSINLLIFSCGIFLLIALNYKEAVQTFGLKDAYLQGFSAFILLGLTRVIDMGTGVNTQIIGTSTSWRFELISGAILLTVMLPLTYILAKHFDIMGPALANLISITIYNIIRIWFLWKKFRLFPFTKQSAYTVLLAAACYCYLLFRLCKRAWIYRPGLSQHGIYSSIWRTTDILQVIAGHYTGNRYAKKEITIRKKGRLII